MDNLWLLFRLFLFFRNRCQNRNIKTIQTAQKTGSHIFQQLPDFLESFHIMNYNVEIIAAFCVNYRGIFPGCSCLADQRDFLIFEGNVFNSMPL